MSAVGDPLLTDAERKALPAGARLVILFEFFERYAFYSTLSLLVLFLSATAADGGLGWPETRALGFVGIFFGLMYALPLLGGLIADRLIGHRAAIVVGGNMMLLGYGLLSWVAVHQGVRAGDPTGATMLAFWGSMACIVTGNALMKSTAVIVFGDAFRGDEAHRERSYTYYYMGINVGAVVAGLASGALVTRLGWPPAFGAAAIGMAIAALTFTMLHRRLLGPAAATAVRGKPSTTDADDRTGTGMRLGLLAFFATALCLFHVGALQIFGSVLLMIEHGVDRSVGEFVIPVQWYTSFNAAALILAPAGFVWLWARLARRGMEPDAPAKYAVALGFGAAGLAMLAWTGWASAAGSWIVPALGVVLLGVGEVAAWTMTYGLVYRLAPRRLVAMVMGAFYTVTLGLGGYGAGWVAGYAEPMGYGRYFMILSIVTAVAACAMLALRGTINRIAGGVGQTL
jgi:POT family proton-dependent oligopeptide transporter